ncbi:hypothetical protein [Trujillonella humicola]|uniref:hypothetical protein n=1 Tax=Trujillonella humicola TaxID=3383699 RepID=UPI0039059A9F
MEAPVHEDRLLATFREHYGVGKVGHVIKGNIRETLTRTSVDGRGVVRNGDVYRVEGRQISVVRVPVDADTLRTVSQVPPEEIDLARGFHGGVA